MRWGDDFLRIMGGIQTLGPMGKIQMSKGEPIKLSTTFLVLFTQSFITARSWLSWLLHGMGKVWQSKFKWEKPLVFGKHDFELWGKLLPKNDSHSLMHGGGCLSPRFWSSWHFAFTFFIFLTIFSDSSELSQEARASCVYPSTILVVYLIFPMDGRSFL